MLAKNYWMSWAIRIRDPPGMRLNRPLKLE
jgi:hypothetical protein